jgi:general secretion pathway protein B
MSFILDALKKSETDRQQHGPAEFAGVPTSNGRQRAPRWLWVLGVLLAINLAVLLGLLLRPEVAVTPTPNQAAAVEGDVFAASTPTTAAPRSPLSSAAPPARNQSASTASLPMIHEVLADGTVTLPALHVDIHVFAEAPEDRFVFINMNKQVEGSRLAEGPVVEEITTDGVVLNYNGTSFVLPRD